jgi:hypothetical protein
MDPLSRAGAESLPACGTADRDYATKLPAQLNCEGHRGSCRLVEYKENDDEKQDLKDRLAYFHFNDLLLHDLEYLQGLLNLW